MKNANNGFDIKKRPQMKEQNEEVTHHEETPLGADTLFSASAIANRYDVNTATIWRWARDGQFPTPIKLGPRVTRWKLSDIQEWEAAKARDR